ncbi:toxin-activating lysine-acyltransferase [Aquisalimonas lutea]|uniref:toxin-activating lysine-acyltransferase n=1 Tax=Aquisalimonas lutea TaxID=1327750 RepID=UPI0025B4ED2E|nr:toxin-activating lysine-acyltransferase [Aquisalimonas lutea]MDN3518667.1 toxin-activating lysine-acyltransferase [Aquisalimonas lutea]
MTAEETGTTKTNAAETSGGDAGDGAPEGGGGSGAQAPQKTVGAALGEIAWLLSQSSVHRHSLFLADLEWLVMPPLMQSQYRLFYAEGQPIGAALWAFVSETVEQRLAAGGRIAAGEWRGGDRVWLVELIAPYGQQDAMLEDLRGTALADRRFRFVRTDTRGRRETVTLDGQRLEGGAQS